ncbi:hypothetical protein OPT61_g3751 [Boeremia exigua]|uniref:Uncharacterized protein n=1 Tax=Boeremia exigua TaxID=749465 RepID=A0ACC2IGN6_9PLEO|nr:hypothetical protein OPT61_g3751 [Boeremia exigua]
MVGVYRVEASPNKRAGCINKECKDKGTKILKGELRFAVQVTIKEHLSWQYKHWGCVTPKQVENLIESSGGDTDMVDGYDELPDEYKEKIDYALENHHIHDDDWNGDVEANRDGRTGMRLTKAELKKKAKEAGEDADSDDKPKQKRGKKAKAKANDEEDEEDEAPAPAPRKGTKAAKKEDSDAEDAPAPKKRGRPTKKEADDEDEAPAPKKVRATRGKKVEYKEEEDDEDEAPPKKKTKAKAKAKAKKATVDSEDEAEPEQEPEEEGQAEQEDDEEAPKPKRGKKAAANGAVKAPPKRGRKKAVADDN